MNIFTTGKLENALSTAALKNKLHTANIANVDTPNYKSKQVDFKTVLSQSMQAQTMTSYKTNEKHLPFRSEIGGTHRAQITTNNHTTVKHNGNNVDMDLEMAELAKNQLWYNALTERVNGKFNSLRTVINEGR
ncbi:MAG: flagellar basal body rod protein FlgB [Bacillus sp. (in: Bacteria)]|nr:flagellar basal body rod protein FlgB [Bacillus sp. (in: firmicutes)]